VVKHDFSVAAHGEWRSLLLGKQENDASILLVVRLSCGVDKRFDDIHAFAVKYLEEGDATSSAHIGNLVKLNSAQPLYRGRLDLLFVKGFEVVNVPKLARLTHSLAAGEATVAVKTKGVINVVEKSKEQEHSNDGGASSALARVAVDNDYVFFVG
jgi:hypothetical protein